MRAHKACRDADSVPAQQRRTAKRKLSGGLVASRSSSSIRLADLEFPYLGNHRDAIWSAPSSQKRGSEKYRNEKLGGVT